MSYPIGFLPVLHQGIVEDRMDPLETGRVRVRVFGIHSPDLAAVPTDKLPWAQVQSAADGGGLSGKGWAPTGLLPGTLVWVYFADGEEYQIPIVTGVAPSINDKVGEGDTASNLSVVTTSTGTTTANGSGTITTTTSDPAAATDLPSGWKLGQTSEKYETGGKGVSTISTGFLDRAKTKADPGGKSYGPWQLASVYTKRDGSTTMKDTTLDRYIKSSSFHSQFIPYPLASDGFDYQWKEICKNSGPAFKEEQYQFVQSILYSPVMSDLSGLGLDTRGAGVQDCVWSMSVQHGMKAKTYMRTALSGKNVNDLSDADIVTLAMNYRMSLYPEFRTRYQPELRDLLLLCKDKVTTSGQSQPKPTSTDSYGAPVYAPVSSAPSIVNSTSSSKGSFRDPSGTYPTNGYKGQPDTNKLARNLRINTTIIQKKKTVVSGNGFNEPVTPYAAKYPYNKVFESESGHTIEIDDTPGAERLHTYHKSGSFIEHHPDGTVVYKSVKDEYDVVMGNQGVYIKGNALIVVEGNAKLKVLGNYEVQSTNDIKFIAEGKLSMLSLGDAEFGSSGATTVSSGSILTFAAASITENGSPAGDMAIDPAQAINSSIGSADSDPPVDVPDESATGDQPITNLSQLPYAVPVDSTASTSARTIKENTATIDTSKLGQKFSVHYKLEDVTTSCAFPAPLQDQAGLTADQIYNNLQFLARNVLDPICDRFGKSTFIITNGLRAANGSHSHHVQGAAADLQFPGAAVSEYPHIAEKIRRLLPAFSQVILEYHAKAPVIHVAYSQGKSATPLSMINGDAKMCFTTFTPDFKPWRVQGNGFYSKAQQLIYKI